jgi:hypothetical protein
MGIHLAYFKTLERLRISAALAGVGGALCTPTKLPLFVARPVQHFAVDRPAA